MIKLLIFADDLTGSLDVSTIFQKFSPVLKICDSMDYDALFDLPSESSVLIVDTETRHADKDSAYKLVYGIASAAKEHGVPYFFKKTDSVMRGNIGAELAAVSDAFGELMHYCPASPVFGRITAGSVQYVDGVPVAESAFGADPFSPVLHSNVYELIEEQSPSDNIRVYDAQKDEDFESVFAEIKNSGSISLLGGCAGFASYLASDPYYEDLVASENGTAEALSEYPEISKLAVISGSINDVTLSQLEDAESRGVKRYTLTESKRLLGVNVRVIDQWLSESACEKVCIFDCGRPNPGALLDETRERVCDNIAEMGKNLLERGLADSCYGSMPGNNTSCSGTVGCPVNNGSLSGNNASWGSLALFVTGGDTLIAFLRKCGISEIRTLAELMPCIVLSSADYRGKPLYFITKSGGIGSPSIVTDCAEMLMR